MGMDEHWSPVYYYCSVCEKSRLAALNYVLKFENLNHEQPAFLNYVLNVDSIDNIEHTNENRPYGISSSDITNHYFSVLSDADIKELYKLYQPDFMLFDYNFHRGNLEFSPGQTTRIRV